MNLQDLARGITDLVLRRARYYGLYVYEVTAEDHGRVSLRRAEGDTDEYPDLPGKIDKLYGSHGLSSVATPGSRVAVAFDGGRPDRPFVVAYLSDVLPVSLTLDADETIQIARTAPHGMGGPSKHVYVGTQSPRPVARESDPTYSGKITFTPGAGVVAIVQEMHDGTTRPIGSIAASSLVFTPDPSSGGVALFQGHITGGSELLSSE